MELIECDGTLLRNSYHTNDNLSFDYTDRVKQVVLNDTEDKYGDLAGILGTGNTAATSLNNVQFK